MSLMSLGVGSGRRPAAWDFAGAGDAERMEG